MRIPLFKVHWNEDDIAAVESVIRRGACWSGGREIERLEGMVSRYIGIRECVAFNSGTSALHAAMLAHGIGKGDEVIVPSFTFIATANAPLFVGAKPVFADIEETTFGIDPGDVADKITRKTKAVIAVHYGGHACRIGELKEIAADNKILLVEDCAGSLGATANGRHTGTFGDSACFSFCQSKLITTGEGGMCASDDKKTSERLRLIRSHGQSGGGYACLGYNFRMPTMCAALGLSQMRRAGELLEKRTRAAGLYERHLPKTRRIRLPSALPGHTHAFQMYTILADKRDSLKAWLEDCGIATKVYFRPAHKAPQFRGLGRGCDLPATRGISGRALSLPMHPMLKGDETGRIARAIRGFYE